MKPKVSVVIPTRNEEKNIGKVLSSLKKQSFKSFEVIVVDGGSTDRTIEIAKKYGARVIKEYGKYRSPANARNIGVEKSRGEIIGILDADGELEKKFLEKIVSKFSKNVFGVTHLLEIKEDTFLEKIRAAFVRGSESPRTPLPLFIKKEFRKKLGKWDPELGFAEDRLYTKKIEEFMKKNKKLRIVNSNAKEYFHLTHTLKELINQQRWYGRTAMYYLKKCHNFYEYKVLLKMGYVLIPFGLISIFFKELLFLFIISLPFFALTGYHTIKSLMKKQTYGIFIPLLDFLMGVGFLIGFIEYFFIKMDRGRS